MVNPNRYDAMRYNRCGRSGLQLPALSLGLWQNFGRDRQPRQHAPRSAAPPSISASPISTSPIITAPRPARPRPLFGEILRQDFADYRDELVISTKAGYRMWLGPYGEWGSRKYLISSLDQSLKRMKLDYVDIFYSHRFDPNTPLEETMGALDAIVRQGKALYVGLSSYNAKRTQEAVAILRRLGTPCLIHQPSYSMLNRWIEQDGLLDTLDAEGIGSIVFSPLAQGMLTDKYLKGRALRQPRRQEGALLPRGLPQRGQSQKHRGAERDRSGARPEPRPDGDRLGAARRARHLRPDRREPA